MSAGVARSKRGRKPNSAKKIIEDQILTSLDIDSEYEGKHKIPGNNAALKFVQTNGLNQTVLESFFQIQNGELETGFLPEHAKNLSLQNAVETNLHGLFSTSYYDEMPELKLQSVDSKIYQENFRLNNKLEFQFNASQAELLKPNHAVHFPSNDSNLRNGFVFNTGGMPLTMGWCPLIIENKRYLFVSTVDGRSAISEFSNSKSLLLVLEVFDETGAFAINKQIILDQVVKEIQFSFVSTSESTLLKLTLSNGAVSIWKIDSTFFSNDSKESPIQTVKSQSATFEIPTKNLLITTSAFTSTNTFVFGTNHGYIGQFTIDTNKLDYLISARIPAITHIKSTFPTQPADDFLTALVEAADFNNYLIRLPIPNKKSCLIKTLKTFDIPTNNKELQFDKNSIYLSNFNAFLNVEWPITVKRMSIDNPNSIMKFKIANDDDINCLTNQVNYDDGLLSDGFVLLTGHTNGSVRLANYLNLATNTEKKTQVSSVKILQLNKSIVTDNKYWLDLCYQVDKIGELSTVKSGSKQSSIGRTKELRNVNPKEVCPLKLAMMGDIVASSWGNGLLIVEHLTL